MAQAQISVINKAVTTAGTPVVLGTNQQRFRSVIFYAPATNTGLTYVQTSSTGGAPRLGIASGGTAPAIFAEEGNYFTADQFYIDGATNGNQVNALYAH